MVEHARKERLRHAAAGDLKAGVIKAQATKDAKTPQPGLAVEFGGNWLGFRDRANRHRETSEAFLTSRIERSDVRRPIRFSWRFRRNRFDLDSYMLATTVVNPFWPVTTAAPGGEDRAFGQRPRRRSSNGGWTTYPMAAFVTKKRQACDQSVKRGYWVAKEHTGRTNPATPR